eukprot:6157536-Pleurochrysis_carterae.AAC.1
MRVPVCKDGLLSRASNALAKVKDNLREKKQKFRKAEASWRSQVSRMVSMRMGKGGEKTAQRDGAGGVCARASVATVNALQ